MSSMRTVVHKGKMWFEITDSKLVVEILEYMLQNPKRFSDPEGQIQYAYMCTKYGVNHEGGETEQ